MLRKVLVPCLVYVTVTGPWLCCCAAGHVVQITRATVALLKSASASEKTHPCCCQRGVVHAKGPAQQTPATPTPRPCPCQQDRASASVGILTSNKLVLTAHEPSPGELSLLRDLSGPSQVVVLKSRSIEQIPKRGAGPPGSGRDRLSILHILIC